MKCPVCKGEVLSVLKNGQLRYICNDCEKCVATIGKPQRIGDKK